MSTPADEQAEANFEEWLDEMSKKKCLRCHEIWFPGHLCDDLGIGETKP